MSGDDVILSEVMARVAFRLIVWDFRSHRASYDDPQQGMIGLSAHLHRYGFRAVSAWVLAAAYYTGREGCLLADWRDWCVRRARLHAAYRRAGQPWRKAPDPRVTNRGVRGTGSVERRPWGSPRARFPNEPIR
jgi:hypothetical protein